MSAGHEVTGTAQRSNKAGFIRSMGAKPAIMDAFEAREVLEAVRQARPDVVIHQLTSIPPAFDIRQFDQAFALTNRLRMKGTDHLLEAARAVKCRRFIAQSFAGWPYERTGAWIKTEEDPLLTSPEAGMRETFDALLYLERAVLQDWSLEGIVLRYGSFYGPGTSIGPGGSVLQSIKRRELPLVGKGTGYWSFVHIDDAASATLAAVKALTPGIYNICDDEPAPVSDWLRVLADVLRADPPKHVPGLLARMKLGPHGVSLMTQVRGASNQKAKSQLGWKPKWTTWRTGFREGLDVPLDAKIPPKTESKPDSQIQEALTPAKTAKAS